MKKSLSFGLLLPAFALVVWAEPGVPSSPKAGNAAAAPSSAAPSSAAVFSRVAEVLRHPRCMNCHTFTDFPRQSDERRPHAMGVLRGADNAGVVGMRCSTCHADENVEDVPGAPHWALAPLSMGWEGLSDAELAASLKDPVKNGKRSLEDLYRHMAEDPLVAWAWKPGGSRQPPAISHEEFARLVRLWIDAGAPIPAETAAAEPKTRP